MWGNQGGYDGGGYDNSGGYIGGSQGDNQGGANQERRKARSTHIMPCTVAQLLKAEQVDDKFMSEGFELNQVSLVGLVRNVQESSTNYMYEIDDMTGPVIEVRLFVENEENTPEHERVPVIGKNTYVHLCGHLRSFSNKKNVTAFKLRKVTDANEITSHIMEVVQARLRLSKKNLNQPSASMPAMFPPQPSFAGGSIDIGLTPDKSNVLRVIRSCCEDQGITIGEITARLRNMSQMEIENAVEFLSNEGHIYSTIDDNHFKATDTN